MNAGALLIPVNTCFFERTRNTGDARRGAVHCGIWAGGLVKNNENTSALADTLSPMEPTTHGVIEVIPIAAMHASHSHRPRNKPEQPDAPPERGPAIVDACRSLQIPHLRRPNGIYDECASTLVRTRADFAARLARVSAEFGPS
jgi:hypothetical protein